VNPGDQGTRRVFLGWDRPVLPAAAEHLLDHYLRDGVADMRAATVVLPGSRARRRLVELLLDEADRRRAILVPPRTTTAGGLAEILAPPRGSVADPVLSLRAWSLALRSAGPGLVAEVFPHMDDTASPAEWDQLADLLAAMHQRLAGEGHRFSDVARVCRSGAPFDDSARWDALAQVQRGYLRLLAQAGLVDPFESRLEALATHVPGHAGDLWLVALADLPEVTRRLMESSGATAYTLIQAPLEMATLQPEPFDAWGLPTTEFWAQARIPVPDQVLAMVERPVSQADAVMAALEALDAATTTQDVVLAVHSRSEVVPYLEQRLRARGVATRYAAGTPLSRTGPVRLLQAVADYMDGRRFPALAALLRHPEVGTLLHRGGMDLSAPHAMEVADAYFNDHLPSSLGGSIPKGARFTELFPALVRALERDGGGESPGAGREGSGIEGPLRRFRGSRLRSRWMPEVMRFLVESYGHVELDRSRPDDRRLLEALGHVRRVALALAQAPAALDEECTGPEAIRAVLAGLAGQSIPPDPDRRAVEILEWLEVPLDDAPVALITGFNEGFLPESASGDSFLPDSLSTRLGLPDNRRRLSRDAYRLAAVLHSKKTVRLIAGRRSANGDPLRPSRLMFRTSPELIAERVLRFLDRPEESSPDVDLAAMGVQPGEATGFTVPPEPVIELRADGIPDRIRVTSFGSLLRDPYRFVLEDLWHLDGVDDAAREMDPLRFGDLAHAALQRFGALAMADPPGVDQADGGDVARALVRLLHEEVASRFGRTPLPAVRLQASQLEARLHAFAAHQAKWAADGWRIVAVECQPQGEGWPLDVDGTPILLRGRMDRIDHNPSTGAWAVLDYKTGTKVDDPEKAHRRGKGDTASWVDLQLPLYWHMVGDVVDAAGGGIVPSARVGTCAVRVGYVGLPQEPAAGGFLLAPWSVEEMDAALDTAREAVRTLRRGRFGFDPGKTRPGREGEDPLRRLLLVGWQSAEDDRDGVDLGGGTDDGEDEA
jgi:hypothetical protein